MSKHSNSSTTLNSNASTTLNSNAPQSNPIRKTVTAPVGRIRPATPTIRSTSLIQPAQPVAPRSRPSTPTARRPIALEGIAASRPSSRVRTRRSASRLGINGGSTTPTGFRSISGPVSQRLRTINRVDELKSKIAELEQVLDQEKAEREQVFTRIERVSILEHTLEKERGEKARLAEKLREYEVISKHTSLQSLEDFEKHKEEDESRRTSSISDTSIVSAKSTNMRNSIDMVLQSPMSNNRLSSSDDSTWKRMYCESELRMERLDTQVRALEHEVEARDQALKSHDQDLYKNQTQLVAFQNAVTELKLNKETLRNENGTLLKQVTKLKQTIEATKSRTSKMEQKLNSKQNKIEVLNTSFQKSQDALAMAMVEMEKKNTLLLTKNKELNELSNKLRAAESKSLETDHQMFLARKQLEAYGTEIDRLRKENEHLNSKMQREQWNSTKQVSVLERELRRKKRLVVALETSLQDLKISLEEKAMENDELNRSIQKVMEHANETIEGAKRNSNFMMSPLTSPRVSSSFNFSSTNLNNMTSVSNSGDNNTNTHNNNNNTTTTTTNNFFIGINALSSTAGASSSSLVPPTLLVPTPGHASVPTTGLAAIGFGYSDIPIRTNSAASLYRRHSSNASYSRVKDMKPLPEIVAVEELA